MYFRKTLAALSLFAGLQLLHCGSIDAGPPRAPFNGAGMQKTLTDFESYAKAAMQAWRTPGMAVAIVKDDQVVYAKGFGTKTVDRNMPADENTVFQVGSTSKGFTAALTAMLVDEKRVRWKDRVVEHLSDFSLYDPWVTREFQVIDLMAQRSGLPSHAGDMLGFFGFSREEIVEKLRYIKPVSSFRAEYGYQNGLFLVAGKIIEKHTGKTWEENLSERIFTPLGMKHSSATKEAYLSAENASSPHRRIKGKVAVIPPESPAFWFGYTFGPAGGINSNVLDMAQWLRVQISGGEIEGKRLISKESMGFLHAPQTITELSFVTEKESYAVGWVHGSYDPYPIIWHDGETGGAKSFVAFVPQERLGIVILSNLSGTLLPEVLGRKFFDLYFGKPAVDYSKEMLAKMSAAEKTGEEALLPATPAAPPLPFKHYVGTYLNDVYEKVTVTESSGGLRMTLGPIHAEITLKPLYRDTFVATFESDDDEAGIVAFQVNHKGKAEELMIDSLNKDGCGVFVRVE